MSRRCHRWHGVEERPEAEANDVGSVGTSLSTDAGCAAIGANEIDYIDVEAEFGSLIPGVVSTCKSAGAPL